MRHYLYTFKDNLVIFNYGFGTYGYVIDGDFVLNWDIVYIKRETNKW